MDPVTVGRSSDKPPLSLTILPSTLVCHAMSDLVAWQDELSVQLSCLPLQEGTFRSFLPSGFRLADDSEIGWSQDALKDTREESRNRIVQLILSYLGRSDRAIALFASMSHDGEKGLEQLRTPFFLVPDRSCDRDALWHYLSRTIATEAAVEVALDEIRAFTGLVVLTRLPRDLSEIRNGARATVNELVGLVSETAFLIGEAFDGDGYLVWEPPPTLRTVIAGR